ncbi:hypothetical protein ACETIH_27000 [Microvirga arabica]|uniref:Transposase n=1 Tax=Microvirga arabica TaxID=1128671 RepID=A0ABV6YG85_9HYPH
MHENDLFPLEAVPSRVKSAILHEFKGRRPTVQEVSRICDKSWLAVPGIGQTALASIRQAAGDQHPLRGDPSAARMSDAELLVRLNLLQEELQSLNEVLNATLSPAQKKVLRSGRTRRASSPTHRHQGSVIAF